MESGKGPAPGRQAAPAGPDLPAVVRAFTGGHGADKVLLFAATRSNEPVETVPAIMREKGVLVVIGDVSLNVPRQPYYDREIDLRIGASMVPAATIPPTRAAAWTIPMPTCAGPRTAT